MEQKASLLVSYPIKIKFLAILLTNFWKNFRKTKFFYKIRLKNPLNFEYFLKLKIFQI